MNLVWLPALAVLTLLVLVIGVRLHAFLALLLVSVGVGLAAGMPPEQILKAMETGMASTVGFIAIVVGLGAMFGEMLECSGGAQLLARRLVQAVGIERAPWALALTGFVVGISVYFDVGFILLVPLIFSLSRETRRSLLGYALPLLAGLAVTHAFLPPHPGPMAVAKILQADIGRVILYGMAAGIPAILIAGVFLSRVIARRLEPPELPEAEASDQVITPPHVGTVTLLILIPVLLIVANTVAQALAPGTAAAQVLLLLGHPFMALAIAALLAFWFLGRRRGMSPAEIQRMADRSLKPGGQIILITGSGGIFKQVLVDSGAGPALADTLASTGLSPLLLAFLLALLIRLSLGSATVSMMTAAGLVAPLLSRYPHLDPALVIVAIASGATACSHVNDSGFWLVKQYLGLSEAQTLKSWTVTTAVIGLVGLLMALLLEQVVR
jgi:Gnt-I system low-affinity gluconate transporter